jgi:type VII secretion-associated serine protease mycosin
VLCGLLLALGTAVPANADATRDQQWSLAFLKAADLAKVGQGEGVTVAVVDTGVDANHPDLKGSVLKGIDKSRSPDGTTTDRVGHGTIVASLIAGHGHGAGNRDGVIGIAPKAKILPIRVGNQLGIGHPDDLAEGIVAAVDANVKIICVALAGSSSDLLARSVAYAGTKGVLIIAGIGNKPEYDVVNYPAAYPGVLAVAGVDREGQISKVSPTAIDEVYGKGQITLAAPSDDIVAAIPGGRYNTATGTSNATALTAGVAAVIAGKYPQATQAELLRRLRDSAVDRGAPGFDNRYGYGVIDPLAALAPTVPPRKDANPSSASSPAASQRAQAAPPKRDYAYGLQLAAIITAICGLPILAVVLIVVWTVRRRRRKRSAAPGPPAPPPGQEPVDTTAWRP